jgi:hypothetical protein
MSATKQDGYRPAVIDQKVLDHILKKLDQLDTLDIIKQDIQELKDIKKDVTDLTQSITFTQGQVDSIITCHEQIVQDNTRLKEQMITLNHQNTFLLDKIVHLEDYSRRENIRICGASETDRENCWETVYGILRMIGCDDVDIQRCHRIGIKEARKTRDIIVRFMFYPAKVTVMQNRKHLPHGIYINDDYSADTQCRINTLRPVLKKARSQDEEARMVGDKLLYKRKFYSVENINTIDFDLQQLSMKQSDNTVAFAGRHSFLSNLHPCQMSVQGQEYSSNEQHFQYRKCQEAGRPDIAAQVLLCSQPEAAMHVGKQVRMPKEWSQATGRKIMKEGVKAKFEDPSLRKKLLATSKLDIFEATRHPLWGIGLPITFEQIFNKQRWTGGNLMGLVLQEVRQELALLGADGNSGEGHDGSMD